MTESGQQWLRQDDQESTKASFPELFFDLVFVFALIQLSEALAADFTFGIAAETLLFIFALWWVWIHTTWITNLLNTEITPVRLLLFAMMFLGIVLAITLPRALGDMGLAFALAYSAMQLGRSLFALYAFRQADDTVSFMTLVRITAWLFLSSVLWIAGGLSEPRPRVILWIAALAVEYAGPVLRYWLPRLGPSPPQTLDISGKHLAERCALFVIIALGETIITTGKNASSHLEIEGTPLVFLSAFLSTVLMWWIYFHDGQERAADKAEETAEPQVIAQQLFTYGHLPIVAGIILTAVGEDFSLSHPEETGSYSHALALLGGPILFLGGTTSMKIMSSRYVPYSHIAGIVLLAACFLLVSFIANFFTQALASAILLVVAVWEYVALRRFRRAAA